VMAGDDFELDVHAQRRRVLWQRTYLQALDRFMVQRPIAASLPTDEECSRRAAALATDAVKAFDAWELEQHGGKARPPAGETAGGGGGDPDEDDPDNLYLGR